MQYENIPTVRLLIIAEIYGLPDAELRRSVQVRDAPIGLQSASFLYGEFVWGEEASREEAP